MAYKNNWMSKKIADARCHQDIAFNAINELDFKARKGKLLTLTSGKKVIDFVSCSYLGLDLDPRVIAGAKRNIKKFGVTFPAARTRIKSQSFITLEKLLNKIFCNSSLLIFSSLHLGHLATLPLLGSGELPSFPLRENGALFILDKTVHNSIQVQRALMEQFGEVVFADFEKLNHISDLFERAEGENKTPIAISDSVGSMGGVAPIKHLFEVAEKHNGYIYLDDAHGTSIHGENGCGYALHVLGNKFNKRLILAASLAKAFGSVAGIIALPTPADVAVMKRFSPVYVFGGPPALPVIEAAIAASHIHLSKEIITLQNKLWENVSHFDSHFKNKIVNRGCPSPVRGIEIGDEIKAINFTKQLRENGFAITAAMYPTVAKKNSILRVALSALHTKKQISKLCVLIKRLIEAS